MDRLLPDSAREDYREVRRGRLMIGLCLALLVMSLLAGINRWMLGEVYLAATSAIMLVLFALVPLSLRKLGLVLPVYILLTIGTSLTFWIIAVTGGLDSTAMIYIPCLAAITFVLLGPRAGTWWLLVIIAGCVLLSWGGPYLDVLPVQADPPSRGMSRAVIATSVIAMLMFYIEHTNTLAQQALVSARQQADSASAAKSTFLATMSHELRTPMNGVLGLTEVLLAEAHTPRQGALLQNIAASGTALVQQLNELLDFSKIEAGELTLEAIPYQPAALFSETLGLMQSTATRKGLDLRLSGTGLDQWACGDPTRLKQVLINLIGNAIKFTEDGFVEVQATWAADRLSVRITDTGIGIPAAHLPRLFQPFIQADATVTRKYGGTGLGLAICRRLVEQLGGEIDAESQPGVGSTFWFDVDAPAHAPQAPAVPETLSGAGQRILLAEDHPINQQVAVCLLENLGYTVSVVSDGAVALEAALAEPFAAVLMDYHMPVMDGLTATRALRDAGFRAPIIALTASVMPEDREACLAAGMDDFISKPITAAALAAALDGVLREQPRFGTP